jgi:hypothetical protein
MVPQIAISIVKNAGEVSNLLAAIQKAEPKLGKHSQAGALQVAFHLQNQ